MLILFLLKKPRDDENSFFFSYLLYRCLLSLDTHLLYSHAQQRLLWIQCRCSWFNGKDKKKENCNMFWICSYIFPLFYTVIPLKYLVSCDLCQCVCSIAEENIFIYLVCVRLQTICVYSIKCIIWEFCLVWWFVHCPIQSQTN